MRKIVRLGMILGLLVSSVAFTAGAALADTTVTIDFEGLAEGQVVSSVSTGSGISGGAVAGSVAVEGINSKFPGQNTAIIFDAECGGSAAGCSGNDADLFFPGQGNVLIIAENLVDANSDGLIDDPDDELGGGTFEFDFSGFGPGEVRIESLWVGDVGDNAGETGEIRLFSGATQVGTIPLPTLANNQAATVNVGVSGVTRMVVVYRGTGAIDDIVVTVEEEGDEGCTPGYWKNHLDSWAATGYSPNQRVDSVFVVPGALSSLADDSLLDALNYSGGAGVSGGARILLRAAVASLLNSAHPDVDFTTSTADVISSVNEALASLNRDTMLALATQLDGDNNLGCPLN